MATMKAIVITRFGGPEVLELQVLPKPDPVLGEALIRVEAFGLNHAEIHMRKGEWDEWNPISGLECVGIVDACPGGELPVGSKVIGVMGGMGRSRPGGYGEFVNVPVTNVAAVQTSLAWEQLAVVPEVYSTAWTCLFTILDLQKSERLLIRGATSTIGQAAVHLAVDAGAVVTATTRQQQRFPLLLQMGVSDVKVEKDNLITEFQVPPQFDKVLNLIGNRVLVESIALTRAGGRMLQAGWLGGLAPVKDFNPMLEMESGVHFSLFHSKMLGSPAFPLSGIPLQDIVTKIEHGVWDAQPSHAFEYEDIQTAHKMLDSGAAGGKIVVKH
ncbi:GroES-like protein [Coniochaeta sp. PMI_546]|nr:GroES-like protein [Coniochaeta sp. PMI_546]